MHWFNLIGGVLLTAFVLDLVLKPFIDRIFRSKTLRVIFAVFGASAVGFVALFIEAISRTSPEARENIGDFLFAVLVLVSTSYISFIKANNGNFIRKHEKGFSFFREAFLLGCGGVVLLIILIASFASYSFQDWIKPYIIGFFYLAWVFYPGLLLVNQFEKIRNGEILPGRFMKLFTLSAYLVLSGVRSLCDKVLDIQRIKPQPKAPEPEIEPIPSASAKRILEKLDNF